ncbi:unnamed protein product [Bursaphelenchus xylophilus]|uniref:(pine wood nematode) hypothetical protein n=1 Tax=Bursaphelenchus xylophilus TaxID=6326 RepID=A0A1I7RXQ7_BURXY|nr:unnamed protein product [Bursaphelenchus xylophilus]CAG9126659.1 unnamed protein product [Bursaphelenchus xylophilus]
MEKVALKPNILPYFRYYVNLIGAEGRDLRRSDVYIGGFMKKFLLTSNRLLHKFLRRSFTDCRMVLAERSCYALSPDSRRWHVDDVRTLISLHAICKTTSKVIHISREPSVMNVDNRLIQAIYNAAKLNLQLHIDESLRSRLIDQVLADNDVQMAGSSTSQPVEAVIAYGLRPMSQVSKMDEEPYSRISIRRRGNAEEQAEHLGNQLDHGHQRTEELYAVDILPHKTVSLNMEGFNFLSLLQYLPLPPLPHLRYITAGFKLLDLHPNDIPVVYGQLLSEIRTATGGCDIFLSNKTSLYSTAYKRQEPVLKRLIEAFKAFYEFSKADVKSKFEQLHCQLKIYLPTEETKCINSWLKLMNTITTCYVLETRSDKWSFQAKLKDPHAEFKASGERYSLNMMVHFSDNVVTQLHGRDFAMIE